MLRNRVNPWGALCAVPDRATTFNAMVASASSNMLSKKAGSDPTPILLLLLN